MPNPTPRFKMTAQTMFGLEDVLLQELTELGAENIEKYNRAVGFEGDLKMLYRANLCLRTALRVLVPIHSFELSNEHELYDNIKAMAWEEYLGVWDTLAVDCSLHSDIFTHSLYLEQKTKDAIVDRFREQQGRRPSVDLDKPTLRIHLLIQKNTCLVSLDSSNTSLHKRGYRTQTNLAPINEVLAAGMILLSDWDKKSNFIDPMCGSATLLIEAALIASNTPPGFFRPDFGFQKWRNFDADIWEEVCDEAEENMILEDLPLIVGGEINENTVQIALSNIREANLHKQITVQHIDFKEFQAPKGTGILMMNPPYGERLDKAEDINLFYKSIGDTLKQNWAGYTAWLISSNLPAIKHLGLNAKPKIKLFNGSLECRFLKYELYEGTKRIKYAEDGSSNP